jgi:hypothetical protein
MMAETVGKRFIFESGKLFIIENNFLSCQKVESLRRHQTICWLNNAAR